MTDFGGPASIQIPFEGRTETLALSILPVLKILCARNGVDTAAPRHLSKVVVLA